MDVRTFLAKNYVNFRGWKTKRKIVVFESDDWGSIRMKDKETYNKLLKQGVPVNKSYFTQNDSIETNEDLYELFGVLSKFRDINNRNPIITFNLVTSNPDTKKIIEHNFENYHFLSIEKSFLDNVFDSTKVLFLYKECIKNNEFIKPQFHGREHLNVQKYMNNLSSKLKYDLLGTENNCLLGLTEGEQIKSRKFYHKQNYMAGFETLNKEHELEINEITKQGLTLFEDLFGFKSKSFVAQSLIWGNHLLPILDNYGIRYIQGAQQFLPLGEGKLMVKNNFSGKKTKYNQLLWRRNASFEPSSNPNMNWADKCLKEVDIAFKWNAPAIINTHRVNYIGSIEKSNRENTLKQFDEFLEKLLKKWPNVEFYSSDELGDLMY